MNKDLEKSVSLYITHDHLEPDEIDAFLGQSSDLSFRRGDAKNIRGVQARHVRGMWSIESACHVKSEDPTEHFGCIVDFVDFNRENLRDLLCKGYEVRLRIHWQIDDEVFSMAISDTDMRILTDVISGIDIFSG